MRNVAPIRNRILQVLSAHPFMSRRQIELYLCCPERTVRQGLYELEKLEWIWQTNARHKVINTRCIYALTRLGIEALAQEANLSPRDYRLRVGLSAGRLARLVLMMERVFQLRTFYLWLSAQSQPRITNAHIASTQSGMLKTDKSPQSVQMVQPEANGENWRWASIHWDVEVGKLFTSKGHAVWIPFHGAIILQRGIVPNLVARSGTLAQRGHDAASVETTNTWRPLPNSSANSLKPRWAFVVVELDLSRLPVERDRERLEQLVAAQDDPRYWGKGKDQVFPVLLIIAQDELRLQDYYQVLRSAALARQLPLPRAYLTTFDEMLTMRNDNTRPIWYSTITGRKTTLLGDTEGVPWKIAEEIPWRKLPLNPVGDKKADAETNGVIAPELNMAKAGSAENEYGFARIALGLLPLEKRLLDEVAAHPFLTRQELIVLTQASRRRVKPGLETLTTHQLLEKKGDRYLLAPRGQRLLAYTAGFGAAVKRYARARGWGKGFDTLIRHGQHTQEENKFFLHLAQVALARGHTLTWLSELESRLYYEAGQRRHSFLPDGRGEYAVGSRLRYEFAVEIDRTRSPQERLRRKLAEYEAVVSSNVLRHEGIELLRVLVLTSSWERAETWCRVAHIVRGHFPIFISTFDRVYASGADAPIWLRADEPMTGSAATRPKVHCFECFDSSRSKG